MGVVTLSTQPLGPTFLKGKQNSPFSQPTARNDGYIGEIRLNLLQSSKFALEEAMEVDPFLGGLKQIPPCLAANLYGI